MRIKTIQEVITLSVFSVFSILYLGEKLKWNYAAGFGCIALAVFFRFPQNGEPSQDSIWRPSDHFLPLGKVQKRRFRGKSQASRFGH